MEPLQLADRDWLVIVVGLLYLSECLSWQRPDAIAFVRAPLARHAVLRLGQFLSNHTGGFLIGSLLPGGTAVICQKWPLAISPLGICASTQRWPWQTDFPDPNFIFRWEEIHKIEAVERDIRINGSTVATVCSPLLARQLAAVCTRIEQNDAELREPLIEEALRDFLDGDRVRNRLDCSQRKAASIRRLGIAMFALAFIIAPAIFWLDYAVGYRSYAAVVLIALVAICHGWIAIAASSVLSATGDYSTTERWSKLLALWLSPAATMRAYDLLGRESVVTYHPLAVASAICSSKTFALLARQTLLDIRHPVPVVTHNDERLALQTNRWFADRVEDQVVALARFTGVCVGDLLAEPIPMDGSAKSYCPRCECQYTLASGSCHHCGGVELRAFSASDQAFLKGDRLAITT